MPPKKRKAPTKAPTPAKKARIGNTSVIDEPEETLPSRPRRKSTGTPQYNFTRPRSTAKKQADDGAEAAETAVPDPEPPKRRGRPPKVSTTTSSKAEAPTTARASVRGRPPSKTTVKKTSIKQAAAGEVKDEPIKKVRGRPRKADASGTVKQNAAKKTAMSKKQSAPKTTKATSKTAQTITKGTDPPRKRGRPFKVLPAPTVASLMDTDPESISGADDIDDEDTNDEESGRQYWLMKAEPNDRIENGVNVKFSIDDLAAAEAPEPWDGVRNYSARNNMRAMRKGDLAFFYHSNCPVPGIVGVMRVVQEHAPDQSAFDPNHPYYDPKSSPSNPRWDCVHVEFVKKFDGPVTLKMLQEDRNNAGGLAGMQLLRMGRLSVSAVTSKEWRYVLDMADEDAGVGEDDGLAGLVDGYESDTDGEVNGGPDEELNGDIAAGQADVGMETEAEGTVLASSEVKGDAEELAAE